MFRKINDGDLTGLKLDKFRNSRFEYNLSDLNHKHQGVTEKTNNTLSRRQTQRNDPPRKGAIVFENVMQRGLKKHGGSLMDHEGSHFGKGPKGYKRLDEIIYTDVCERLTTSSLVDASQIVVRVKDGIVYLHGVVSDRLMKKMAEYEIESISGVQDVQNFLTPQSRPDS
jgi:hypothetical protein